MVIVSHASVLALWLLANHVLSQTTTAISPTSTNSALISASTFVSPSLRQEDAGGLSGDRKIGISIGVTLGAIILVGSIAIFCVIRRRHSALSKPETRAPGPGDIDDENRVGEDDPGKDKGVYYMSSAATMHNGALVQAPDGTIYQSGGYPMIPEQSYSPQQQNYAMVYPPAQPGGTYGYSGTAYPAIMTIDSGHQNGYAGPSNTQYRPEAHLQFQQQQQQGSHISWIYPVSSTSPVEPIAAQDFQYKYLQDYQQPPQSPPLIRNQQQNRDPASDQGAAVDAYYVPPPHPHISELPDQRRPVELMGEGHYKEAP
ncbi:hypothetical protein NUW58_g8219 [Xylaria curta]|uniref:Uncharacterized protein n=1 Tax=Xylaria curta TaxID=42375 RepID=A0ACC1N9H1_9PEZI|nr:hypothetical protein NUW58_g8219 [Xylaria curta]